MKRNLLRGIFIAFVATLSFTACSSGGEVDLTMCDSFQRAKPVWAEGREREKNLTLSFREVVSALYPREAYARIAASCNYRLKINGEFVAHGPSVAAHDHYRVDCIDIAPYMKMGKNLITIEVAGYNEPSYYLLDQPSFLQAEVELNGKCVAATGSEFKAYDLAQRKQDVPKLSFQRPHMEHYILSPDFDVWQRELDWSGDAVTLKVQEPKTLLERYVPYPDYTLHYAEAVNDNLFKFKCNSSGFMGIKVKVEQDAKFRITFDELLGKSGRVEQRMAFDGRIAYELKAGEYEIESYEPYTMQYAELIVESGKATIEQMYMRDYCNGDCQRGTFTSPNKELNRLFEAARETYRQNAVDIFSDCPSRERAGWLCDSYFTSRVAFDLSGNTRVERNFLQNFLLPERFKDIKEGMLPMCYPSDHWNHNYIPNWAMWYVIELEEYLHRSGDRELIDQAKKRVYALLDYFKPYFNSDGLLEKLSKWVFVEWSEANSLVQDVSYPSNMLYTKVLDVVARLYNDPAAAAQAEQMRQTIRKQSFDGEYFVDNAVRSKGGKLELSGKHTETCQYYAFFTGVATPELYPELWTKLRDEFGPARKRDNKYPDVPFSNAFIGNYLRLEVLSEQGLSKQILNESIAEYLTMANQTGTLWENLTSSASCNHGFASHIIRVLNRDVLGVYDISPTEKLVRLRFVDSGLDSCKGSIPVGEGSVDLEWKVVDSNLEAIINLPEGYRYEVIPTQVKSSVSLIED